jgi:hypothetical protein
MSLEAPGGVEVLRIASPGRVSELNDWVHDGYLEDALRFSAQSARAVIPFAQESGWGSLHPSMPDPVLVKTTLLARHYHVPLTRCYVVVEHAQSLETDIEWGNPGILEADVSESTFRLMSGSYSAAVSVRVSDLDIRLVVSAERSEVLYRKVLRGWPVESDRRLNPATDP